MAIKKLGFMKKLNRQIVAIALAGAITMGTVFSGGISYATDAFPVYENWDLWGGSETASIRCPVKVYPYTSNTKWRVFEHVSITETHRQMLKDLRANLDSVKAGRNLDSSFGNIKALLEQLLVQVNNHSLGRPQELLDALRYAIDTLDTLKQDGFSGGTRKAWQSARKALTEINKRLKFPNSRVVVYLDGLELYADDVQAQVIDGRTMVPLRALGDALGLIVEWDDATKTAIFTGNKRGYCATYPNDNYFGVQIRVKLGSNTIEATHYECEFEEGTKELRETFPNGEHKPSVKPKDGREYAKTVKMDVVPQTINGRIMIPARFFLDAYYEFSDSLWSAEIRDRLKNVSGGYNLISLYSSFAFSHVVTRDNTPSMDKNPEFVERDKKMKDTIMLMNSVDIEMYANELRPVERDAYKLLSQRHTANERIAEHIANGGRPNSGLMKGVYPKGYDIYDFRSENYLGQHWGFLAGQNKYSDGPMKHIQGNGPSRYPIPLMYSVARAGKWSGMYGFNYSNQDSVNTTLDRMRAFLPSANRDTAIKNKIVSDSRLVTMTDYDFFHIEGGNYVLDYVEFYGDVKKPNLSKIYEQGTAILVFNYRTGAVETWWDSTDEFVKFE